MILHGDCLELMPTLPAESVDAVVTDPPYGLGFMGKHWDHGVPNVDFWQQMYRLLKPGGHLLSFGGTRTVHRIASAIEDAGFEIRDELVWIYSQGFPKSLDVSKAFDRMAGAEREKRMVPTKPGNLPEQAGPIALGATGMTDTSEPVSDLARQWDGWGTALKPAHEPIVMARKPLVGTVAGNVAKWGTGAINVDGTRIGTTPRTTHADGNHQGTHPAPMDWGEPTGHATEGAAGRWPSNILLSDPELFGDYARFFIIPKASRAERERGLAGATERVGTNGINRPMRVCVECGRMKGGAAGNCQCGPTDIVEKPLSARANVHPTVKPIDLMRHLVRLVTPPGGTVLDPFLGSGTTAIACELEGFQWIGMEREAEYVAIAEGRILAAPRGLGL